MAILFSTHELSHSFAGRNLFRNLSFGLDSKEKVGLIGPNGSGKSTLLKIIAGLIPPEEGKVSFQKGLKVAYLAQKPVFAADATVIGTILESSPDEHDWEEVAKASEILAKLNLPPEINGETRISSLSGGWQKRVAFARELFKSPDLFLLDEPTNHLDVESIIWLENILTSAPYATLTVTHDRYFLDRISDRILELDIRNPGGLLSVSGSYSDYLTVKSDLMLAQGKTEEKLINTLRRETEWLKRGAKARTTKQQARIQRAEALANETREVSERNRVRDLRIEFQAAAKNPKRLLVAEGISKSYGKNQVIPPLDLVIGPKTRLGILGKNGSGKSTLLRLLLGQEKPDSGSVFRSEHLLPLYFEQNKESLDPDLSLVKTLCPHGDTVEFSGRKIHIKGYLDRFLFRPEQMELPVGKLSGGEQSRLLLARLMLSRSNFMVLDEPTNDLDIPTLNVLEDVLKEFDGAVILVTHDRFFLDSVAEEILAIHAGTIQRFSSTGQWESWMETQKPAAKTSPPSAPAEKPEPQEKKRRLGYKEQRELAGMEEAIQRAEAEVARLEKESLEFASQASKLLEITSKLAAAQAEVERLYARWAELEN